MIRRPALRYFGGKWRIAPWIVSFFPEHTCYVEPFAGACSVLLRKTPSQFEYANDLSSDIFNFFQVLRTRKNELLEQLRLTPFSRLEFVLSYEHDPDPLERARRFFVRCWQGHNGSGARSYKTGWRYQLRDARGSSAINDFIRIEHLEEIVQRLRAVGWENDTALNVIRRFDLETTLFYVDPPYLRSTRTSQKYENEFSSDEDHRALGELLLSVNGSVVLSGYRSDLYAEIFEQQGWERFDIDTLHNAGRCVESVWLNPACQERRRRQLSLFDEVAS